MNISRIYKLVDSAGCIRYIGKTTKSLTHRLQKHLGEARGPLINHRLNWIRSLSSPPVIEEICTTLGDWKEAERYWISIAKEYGCQLVNGTEGGEGLDNPTEEVRSKISNANSGTRNGMFGKKRSAYAIEKTRQAHLGYKHSDESRQKISVANSGAGNGMYARGHTEQTRCRMKLSQRQRRLLEKIRK